MQKPKCDKCGGIEFEEEQEEIEYIPASEYFKTRWHDWAAASTYYPKPMICKECGAKYPTQQFTILTCVEYDDSLINV